MQRRTSSRLNPRSRIFPLASWAALPLVQHFAPGTEQLGEHREATASTSGAEWHDLTGVVFETADFAPRVALRDLPEIEPRSRQHASMSAE